VLRSYYSRKKLEAGCDEAGRGCLAGPVFAAAVILPKNFKNKILNDSKLLTEEQRYELREVIEKEAIDFAVEMVDNYEIDEINILNASFLAMQNSVKSLKTKPELLLIDGNRFNPMENFKHKCVIKGDAIFASIAAASVLAKTYRDDFMKMMHRQLPVYNWENNKGYPTKEHRTAIEKFGASSLHRKTFKLLPEQEKVDIRKGVSLF